MSPLLETLDLLGIRVDVVEHPAVYTVELPGAHLKNLLVRNKKKQRIGSGASRSRIRRRCLRRLASSRVR
jgi:hypothetical protein